MFWTCSGEKNVIFFHPRVAFQPDVKCCMRIRTNAELQMHGKTLAREEFDEKFSESNNFFCETRLVFRVWPGKGSSDFGTACCLFYCSLRHSVGVGLIILCVAVAELNSEV